MTQLIFETNRGIVRNIDHCSQTSLSYGFETGPKSLTGTNVMRQSEIVAALIEGLIVAGKLSNENLARAMNVTRETSERIDKVLTRLGLAEEADIASGLSELLRLERAVPEKFPSQPPHIDTLGPKFLSHARVLPIASSESVVVVAIADPLDPSPADAIGLKLRRQVKLCVATPSEIETALDRIAEHEDDTPETSASVSKDTASDVERLRDLASEAPVIRYVTALLRKASEAGASDIHIEPAEQSVRVRFRVDGVLRDEAPPSRDLRTAVVSRLKIMARLDIAEQRLPQDGRIRVPVAGRALDIRVATLPSLHGEALVLRLLDQTRLVLDLASLGFDERASAETRALIARSTGIVLVTGPTGSGKTTTLYAALSELTDGKRKIVTIEDPVEYDLNGITQVQVKSEIGMTFAHGLRAILRHDPDVIMIGEIRDLETARIAVQAALTGHLVLATLHTNSAAAAIDRLRDMGVEDYLLAATVNGVVAQRLVRRLCKKCTRPTEPNDLSGLSADCAFPTSFEPTGCPSCHGTGYSGRTAILEILTFDAGLRQALVQTSGPIDLEASAIEAGMRSLRRHGLEKVARGETALPEVHRVTFED